MPVAVSFSRCQELKLCSDLNSSVHSCGTGVRTLRTLEINNRSLTFEAKGFTLGESLSLLAFAPSSGKREADLVFLGLMFLEPALELSQLLSLLVVFGGEGGDLGTTKGQNPVNQLSRFPKRYHSTGLTLARRSQSSAL